MNANVYDEDRAADVPQRDGLGKPKQPKAPARAASAAWLVSALLILSAIPLASGAFRLTQLAGGAAISPANARFFDIATIPDHFVLVLDDYHIRDAKPIDDALTFLLEHLPPQMHLVITTREDPQLPLARLRARDQLTELRDTDLRFTPSMVLPNYTSVPASGMRIIAWR